MGRLGVTLKAKRKKSTRNASIEEIIHVAKSGEGGSVQDGGNQIFRELGSEGGKRRPTEASRFREPEPRNPILPKKRKKWKEGHLHCEEWKGNCGTWSAGKRFG